MDGGIGEAALAASLAGGEAAGASTAPALLSALPVGADIGGSAGLLGGLGAGAAGELGATSSGIGAAGAPANPASIGFGNMMSMYGKPALGALGTAGRLYGAGNALGGALGVPGLGMAQQPAPMAARPPMGMAPISSAQTLGSQFAGGMPQGVPPGGAAAMVANRMGMAPQGAGGGMSPMLLQLMQQMMAQRGGMQ